MLMTHERLRTTDLVLLRAFLEFTLTEESLNNHNSIKFSRESMS